MAEDTLIALDPASAPPFEEVLETLQTLVQRLEGGELALEESLRVFEEGVRLARLGTRQLDEAEQRVEALLADDGSASARPTVQKEPDGS